MITESTTKLESSKRSKTGAKTPVHFTAHLRRKTAVVSRWLHVYLSMVSFAIVLFFSVTGLTLNHTEWFANAEKTIRTKGEMPHQWLRPTDTSDPDKLAIVEHLRSVNKLHGAVSDFRTEDNQISVAHVREVKPAALLVEAGVVKASGPSRQRNVFYLTQIIPGWLRLERWQ